MMSSWAFTVTAGLCFLISSCMFQIDSAYCYNLDNKNLRLRVSFYWEQIFLVVLIAGSKQTTLSVTDQTKDV